MEKIGLFCSASADIAPVYFERAAELGRWMGEQGMTLVYGGSDSGLMECVAQAMKPAGGRIFGVVPSKLEERGRVSACLDVCFYTCDLSDRKETMVREAEVFVALPGGVGTLDEVFTVMAARSLGYHDKKVIFYNIDGFYDDLLALLDRFSSTGFIHRPLNHYFEVARTLEELNTLLTGV